jgi:hypothetical protein
MVCGSETCGLPIATRFLCPARARSLTRRLALTDLSVVPINRARKASLCSLLAMLLRIIIGRRPAAPCTSTPGMGESVLPLSRSAPRRSRLWLPIIPPLFPRVLRIPRVSHPLLPYILFAYPKCMTAVSPYVPISRPRYGSPGPMRCQRVWRGVAWTRSEGSKMSRLRIE